VQAETQQRYVRLIAQGLNNSEACRLVGINRKTGNRWRYGRAVPNTAGEVVRYPPIKLSEPKRRSPRYLSEPERIALADLLAAGDGHPRDRPRTETRALDNQSRNRTQQRP
jgi:hypothetical protein